MPIFAGLWPRLLVFSILTAAVEVEQTRTVLMRQYFFNSLKAFEILQIVYKRLMLV